MVPKITPKQQRFVDEYLIDLNATQAAIRAGYSVKTAEAQGSRLLTIVNVAQVVGEALAERSKRTGVNQDRIVQELAKIAFADMGTFVSWDENGITLIKSDELAGGETAAVYEISETEVEMGLVIKRTTKIKLHDKQRAMELLGKHLGMFKDDKPIGNVNIQIIDNIPSK